MQGKALREVSFFSDARFEEECEGSVNYAQVLNFGELFLNSPNFPAAAKPGLYR